MYKIHYEDIPNIELVRILGYVTKATLTIDPRFYLGRDVDLYVRCDELALESVTDGLIERATLSFSAIKIGIEVVSNLDGSWRLYTESESKDTNPTMTFIKLIKHSVQLYTGRSYSPEFLILNKYRSFEVPAIKRTSIDPNSNLTEKLVKIEELKSQIMATEFMFNQIKNMDGSTLTERERKMSDNFMLVSKICMKYQSTLLKYRETELENQILNGK